MLKELKRIKALEFRLRTAQELSKVNQGRQNKSMLVEKVSERYLSFFCEVEYSGFASFDARLHRSSLLQVLMK